MFTPTTPFPLQLHIRKKAARTCQTQSLGHWHHFMTVFETTQEKEIKILPPLFPTTHSWLQARALYKPVDSSRVVVGGGTVLEARAYCLPLSTSWELKRLSISSELCLHIFIWLRWTEKARVLSGNSLTMWAAPEDCSQRGNWLSCQRVIQKQVKESQDGSHNLSQSNIRNATLHFRYTGASHMAQR